MKAEIIKPVERDTVETLLVWFRLFFVVVLVCGVYLAWKTNTPYWVDRSGKVVVASSLFLTYLQFRFEASMPSRMSEIMKRAGTAAEQKALPAYEVERALIRARAALTDEIEMTRHRVLVNALLMAGAGELVAAFGGFTFSAVLGGAVH